MSHAATRFIVINGTNMASSRPVSYPQPGGPAMRLKVRFWHHNRHCRNPWLASISRGLTRLIPHQATHTYPSSQRLYTVLKGPTNSALPLASCAELAPPFPGHAASAWAATYHQL